MNRRMNQLIVTTVFLSFSVPIYAHVNCELINGKVVCPPKPGTTPGGGDMIILQQLRKGLDTPKTIKEKIRELQGQLKVLEGVNG